MSYYKKIEGNHLYLASIDCDKDASLYMEWNNSKERDARIVFEGYTGKEDLTEETAREELNDLAVKNAFAIIDKGSNEMIGLIGLSNTQAMNQRSNLWIQMDTTMDYNKQIDQGVDALHLMLEYCFDIMNLHSIIMEFPAFNRQAFDICKDSNMLFMSEREQAVLLENGLYDNMISYQCSPMIYEMETALYANQDLSHIGSNIRQLSFNEVSKMRDILTGANVQLVTPSSIAENKKDHYIHTLAAFLNDPEISIPLGEYKTNWNNFRAKRQLESVDYVIEKDDKLIGYVNLFRKNERNRSADLEVVIGDKSEQRKGYGKEAMSLFLTEEYQNGIYNSLISNIFDFNKPSLRLHQSLGYQKIGDRYEAYYANGSLRDMQTYEMNQEIYANQDKTKKIRR